ncbi:hypothetical protein GGF46_002796 [Coemansia sp. RSA 552]|nr:hypothetical protein GGF46_002866 [Coemansia sp. RSA 552]KAJ2159757.1 hypothetical protein GGF46_002796 [Coemansia sp. RSA 552]
MSIIRAELVQQLDMLKRQQHRDRHKSALDIMYKEIIDIAKACLMLNYTEYSCGDRNWCRFPPEDPNGGKPVDANTATAQTVPAVIVAGKPPPTNSAEMARRDTDKNGRMRRDRLGGGRKTLLGVYTRTLRAHLEWKGLVGIPEINLDTLDASNMGPAQFSVDSWRYRGLYYRYRGPLGANLFIPPMRLIFFRASGGVSVYRGEWMDGKPVIIKAALRNYGRGLAKLERELAAYRTLYMLQGGVVPLLYAHGYASLDGKDVALLVIERIPGANLRPERDMDGRWELTHLNSKNRVACMDALHTIANCGVIHGCVRGSNLLFRPYVPGKTIVPVFIDFAHSVLMESDQVTDSLWQKDLDDLLNLLSG